MHTWVHRVEVCWGSLIVTQGRSTNYLKQVQVAIPPNLAKVCPCKKLTSKSCFVGLCFQFSAKWHHNSSNATSRCHIAVPEEAFHVGRRHAGVPNREAIQTSDSLHREGSPRMPQLSWLTTAGAPGPKSLSRTWGRRITTPSTCFLMTAHVKELYGTLPLNVNSPHEGSLCR